MPTRPEMFIGNLQLMKNCIKKNTKKYTEMATYCKASINVQGPYHNGISYKKCPKHHRTERETH